MLREICTSPTEMPGAALPVLCPCSALFLALTPSLPGLQQQQLQLGAGEKLQAGCRSPEKEGVTAPALCSLTLPSKLH